MSAQDAELDAVPMTELDAVEREWADHWGLSPVDIEMGAEHMQSFAGIDLYLLNQR